MLADRKTIGDFGGSIDFALWLCAPYMADWRELLREALERGTSGCRIVRVPPPRPVFLHRFSRLVSARILSAPVSSRYGIRLFEYARFCRSASAHLLQRQISAEPRGHEYVRRNDVSDAK
ncbi:hypothetical protein MRX96_007472 [Rhipicephalus microplus]